MNAANDLPLETDCREVQARLAAGAPYLLLDCREPDEYALACVDGSTLIPLRDIPERLAEIEEFKGQTFGVMCHHGQRSLHATMWLRAQGFAGAQSVRGGIDRWSLDIDPDVPRY